MITVKVGDRRFDTDRLITDDVAVYLRNTQNYRSGDRDTHTRTRTRTRTHTHYFIIGILLDFLTNVSEKRHSEDG